MKSESSQFKKERKISYAKFAKFNSKNKYSTMEIVKKEKEIYASFSVVPQTAKVRATVHDKCLAKMETALNLWIGDLNGKIFFPLYSVWACLYEDFSKLYPDRRETQQFAVDEEWLYHDILRERERETKFT